MIEVLKRIIRSLGIKLEDVRISRLHDDLGNGSIVPTDDWIIRFEYKEFDIVINLNKVSTKDSWMLLSKYSSYDGEMFDIYSDKLADITAEDLREVIDYFINKEV